jgi:hypothetical protein
MTTFCIKEEIVYAILLLLLVFYLRIKGTKTRSRVPIIINKIINKKRPLKKKDPFLQRDHAVLSNPLVAPFRRMARHVYSKNNLPFNYPTRGIADNFQYMGNLIRQGDEKIVKLFGRQKYPRSSEYEYYGMMSDHGGSQIKVQISNTKELYNGDIVNIPLLHNGSFKVQLHKLDEPRYNP